MKFTNAQIEFMRQDLESGMQLSKMIMASRKMIESEGRDFDAEVEHLTKTGEMKKIKKV